MRSEGRHQRPPRATSATTSACSRCRARRPQRCCSRSPTSNLSDINYYHFTSGKVAGVGMLHLPHRLHRRGRLRALLSLDRHAEALGRAHRRRRRHARRTRRPRLAAARDGHGALRQRHRRHHHAARGQPRLAREAQEGRLRRAATRSTSRRSMGSRGSSSGSPRASATFRGTAIRCSTTASRWVVRSGTMSPTLGIPIGTALSADGGREGGTSSRSRSAASAFRPTW